MRYVDLAVRRFVETTAMALGVLVVIGALWLGLFAISSPECSVDADQGDAVLASRVMTGGWMVLEVVLALVVGGWFARSSDSRWARPAIATLLPIGAILLWVAYGGFHDAVIDGLGAGDGTGACW